MRIEFNKTIEEMARLGYTPVIGPAIVDVLVNDNFDQTFPEQLKRLPEAIRNLYRATNPESHLVDLIEVAVLKLDCKRHNEKGEQQDSGWALTILGERPARAYVPVLPYILTPDPGIS